jgi:hypothetical protein
MFTANKTESRILKKISDFSKIKTKTRKKIVETKQDRALKEVKSIIFNDKSKLTATQKLQKVYKLFK